MEENEVMTDLVDRFVDQVERFSKLDKGGNVEYWQYLSLLYHSHVTSEGGFHMFV